MLVGLLARRDRFAFGEAFAGLGLVAVCAVVGARIWSVIGELAAGHEPDLFSAAGFASGGALVGGGLALVVWRVVQGRESLKRSVDVLVPAGLIGLALTRLGCLFEGCHPGRVTDVAWAVQHPGASLAVHPFGAYVALPTLALLALLSFYRPQIDGRRGALAAGGYGVIRFVAEFFREGDGVLWLGLHDGHLVALGLVVVAALFLWWCHLVRD